MEYFIYVSKLVVALLVAALLVYIVQSMLLIKPVHITPLEQVQSSITCVSDGARTQVEWACPSGTTVSRGVTSGSGSFRTYGAAVGSVSLVHTGVMEYRVVCLRGHITRAELVCVTP